MVYAVTIIKLSKVEKILSRKIHKISSISVLKAWGITTRIFVAQNCTFHGVRPEFYGVRSNYDSKCFVVYILQK